MGDSKEADLRARKISRYALEQLPCQNNAEEFKQVTIVKSSCVNQFNYLYFRKATLSMQTFA